MLSLEYMDDSDFDSYLDWSVKNYADEKVRAGTWPADDALRRSREEFSHLLPAGRKSDNMHLFKMVEGDTSAKVGILWVGISGGNQDYGGAFIWDIMVYPEFRGKGYGKGALAALESKVRQLGAHRITLHVFGHNTTAIGLYRKSGYLVTDLIMSKELGE